MPCTHPSAIIEIQRIYTSSKRYQLRLGLTAYNRKIYFQYLKQDRNLFFPNVKEVRKWVMYGWYAGCTELSRAYSRHDPHGPR